MSKKYIQKTAEIPGLMIIEEIKENEIKIEIKKTRYCKTCGSKLGIDCGEAEPDYNKELCSFGCYLEYIKPVKSTELRNVRN